MAIDFDKLTSGVTGAPATWIDQCCEVVLSSGTASFADSATFTPPATAYVRYEIILGAEGLNNNQERMLFWLNATEAAPNENLVLAYLRQVSGALQWRFRVYESSLTVATIYTTTGTGRSLDTPYRLEFKWDTSAAGWEIRQDGTTLFSGGLTNGQEGLQLDQVGLGAWETGTGSATYYLDNIAVATDIWVGADESPESPPAFDVTKFSPSNRIAIISM